MANEIKLFLRAIAILAAFTVFGPGLASAEIIRIAGSGCAIGTIRILGEAFRKDNPEAQFRFVPGMGTSGAAKAVVAGRLDIGLGDRPLSGAERSSGAVETMYAGTPLVFAVNRFVETGGLTLDEVARIYGGSRDRWDNRTRIRLILRPAGNSATKILRSMSPVMRTAVDGALRREGMIVAVTDEDAAAAIENTPGAFGALALSQVLAEKRAVRVLALDGIVPSARTMADGSYPYGKTFSMITTKKRRTVVNRFMEFVRSKEGVSILEKNGQAAMR
jgi:phosphate transport system substrate-binding protein